MAARQEEIFQRAITLYGPMLLCLALRGAALRAAEAQTTDESLNLRLLRNPVWSSHDNLRDPSVLKTQDGYLLFYSRFKPGEWNSPANWSIGCVFTRDFVHYENDHDISPTGCASPGDLIFWGGRHVLPYQFYPGKPVQLCFSESNDLRIWSTPTPFLIEARQLPWNLEHRVIDPTFVIDGKTLHCFFVGTASVPDSTGKMTRANLLGHAVTQDPRLQQWTILTRDKPLIGASDNIPDGVENIMVFKTDQLWTMIYSEGLAHQHLARATSPDLVSWTLTGPIDLPRQKWMAHRYGAPYVWREQSQWMMILMGEDADSRTTFGLLTSHDGKDWKLMPEKP
jgi:sucrose-6-phosphate hydrolase SacC (GH32 family)